MQRDVGYPTAAVGLSVIVLAVLLFGLTTDEGGIDWISVVMAVAGLVMVGVGLYSAYHSRGTGTTPHASS